MRVPLLLLTVFLASCSSVNFDAAKPTALAVDVQETRSTSLGRLSKVVSDGLPPDHSGFHMLNDAVDALALRLLLAERAEQTIDAQYYLIKPDISGLAFMHTLVKAADRGVRVRLLVDDMFTLGQDDILAALDKHPNFSLRIFNPFANRRARWLDGITSFSRINRRMHNKSFTVDNQLSLIGGRNIADEYFGARKDARFGDLDVLTVGPLVNNISSSFDAYWNHERAVAPESFASPVADSAEKMAEFRKTLQSAFVNNSRGVYGAAVKKRVERYLDEQKGLFTSAPYALAMDSPDKSFGALSAGTPAVKRQLKQTLSRAEKELILVSPYFVPEARGVERLLKMRERGVRVRVITNSLAANNQFAVHAGYAPRRRALLEGGVELYEVRPDAEFAGQDLVAASSARSTLHTKAFVVDREMLFIGSFNFDPRSADINTEMGVVISSQTLAEKALTDLEPWLRTRTWQVTLTDSKELRWQGLDSSGKAFEWRKEPRTSAFDRFLVRFVSLLPVDSLL